MGRREIIFGLDDSPLFALEKISISIGGRGIATLSDRTPTYTILLTRRSLRARMVIQPPIAIAKLPIKIPIKIPGSWVPKIVPSEAYSQGHNCASGPGIVVIICSYADLSDACNAVTCGLSRNIKLDYRREYGADPICTMTGQCSERHYEISNWTTGENTGLSPSVQQLDSVARDTLGGVQPRTQLICSYADPSDNIFQLCGGAGDACDAVTFAMSRNIKLDYRRENSTLLAYGAEPIRTMIGQCSERHRQLFLFAENRLHPAEKKYIIFPCSLFLDTIYHIVNFYTTLTRFGYDSARALGVRRLSSWVTQDIWSYC